MSRFPSQMSHISVLSFRLDRGVKSLICLTCLFGRCGRAMFRIRHETFGPTLQIQRNIQKTPVGLDCQCQFFALSTRHLNISKVFYTELRIWLGAGQRVDRVDVRRPQDVRPFVAYIGNRGDDTLRKASLHRCGPGGDIHVPMAAVPSTRRNNARRRVLKKRVDRITQAWLRNRSQRILVDIVRVRKALMW